MATQLNSIPTLVESPFIIVKIGDVTFGSYTVQQEQGSIKVNYPNYMKSLTAVKVNGTVNTYTIQFTYQVRPGEDPNLLDKILSKAANNRRLTIKYGDWNAPSYIYREEKAIITKVTSVLNLQSSAIDYTVSCQSDTLGIFSTPFNFPARNTKPSDEIKRILGVKKYGLQEAFPGMTNLSKVLSSNLIASNDKKVQLNAQRQVNVMTYLQYLVNSMVHQDTKSSGLSSSQYFLTIKDDYNNLYGGTYFKVEEVKVNTRNVNSIDTYEIDINYPGDNFVTQFSINDDQSWSILYEYSESIKQEQLCYRIGNDGHLIQNYAPSISRSETTNNNSATKNAWWSKMTQFPIKATLTIKGLTRHSILMSYVKLNVLFSGGLKHISSGLYIITKQTDTINSSGYKTTLELLRVGGDE